MFLASFVYIMIKCHFFVNAYIFYRYILLFWILLIVIFTNFISSTIFLSKISFTNTVNYCPNFAVSCFLSTYIQNPFITLFLMIKPLNLFLFSFFELFLLIKHPLLSDFGKKSNVLCVGILLVLHHCSKWTITFIQIVHFVKE